MMGVSSDRTRWAAVFGSAAIVAAVVSGCGSSDEEVDLGPRVVKMSANDVLPVAVDNEAAGWKVHTLPRQYVGDALFDFFGLDLEIYLEYGCERVRVQRFENEFGDIVRVELYDAKASLGGYGMFSLRTSPGGERVDVGDVGWRHGNDLFFWRGRSAVSLITERSRAVTVRGIVNLAVSVDQGLGDPARVPRFLRLLPTEGLLPQGIAYVGGPAGLKRITKDLPATLPSPEQAMVGSYSAIEGVHKLFVLRYPTEEAAADAAKSVAADGIVLETRTVLAVIAQGRHLFAFYGPRDVERAKVALSRAVRRLKEADPESTRDR